MNYRIIYHDDKIFFMITLFVKKMLNQVFVVELLALCGRPHFQAPLYPQDSYVKKKTQSNPQISKNKSSEFTFYLLGLLTRSI